MPRPFTVTEYMKAEKQGLDLNDWKDYVKFREIEDNNAVRQIREDEPEGIL